MNITDYIKSRLGMDQNMTAAARVGELESRIARVEQRLEGAAHASGD